MGEKWWQRQAKKRAIRFPDPIANAKSMCESYVEEEGEHRKQQEMIKARSTHNDDVKAFEDEDEEEEEQGMETTGPQSFAVFFFGPK